MSERSAQYYNSLNEIQYKFIYSLPLEYRFGVITAYISKSCNTSEAFASPCYFQEQDKMVGNW